MANRPSNVSLASSYSSSTLLKSTSIPSLAETSLQGAKPLNGNGKAWIQPQSADYLDPDELFTTHTISEVKAVQRKLRTDADAKQEELRLMVGERYRDLLQASTSIISIAQSSKHVLEAVDEMRSVIRSESLPHKPQRPQAVQEDKHLQTLQSLSAHIKLLLDAPEHLWRLMERKMYLHAAWLFLLARVVHRALLHDEDEDEDDGYNNWEVYGIDVSEQFPLVQRQWDAVSQFRSQIVHKATLSLRESTSTPGEICATLLTLHLLESRPLSETLSIFLVQRSKVLSNMLAHTQEHTVNATITTPVVPAKGQPTERSRKARVREIKQKIEAILDLISGTLGIAREIFEESDSNGQVSMMRQALQYIQGDQASVTSLPSELHLTTQSLLTSLPSSAHFLLLPPPIKSYKPYINSASLSSTSLQVQLQEKLRDWFNKSVQTLQTALAQLLAGMDKIHEVWDVRRSAQTWIETAVRFVSHEKTVARTILDAACQMQITTAWKLALDSIESAFHTQLAIAMSAFSEEYSSNFSDAMPVEYLFQAPPMPSVSQVGSNVSTGASFKKYTSALRRQINGRTRLLEDVLGTIEHRASVLQKDLDTMNGDENSQHVRSRLIDAYKPDAKSSCATITAILISASEDVKDDTELCMRKLAFFCRLTEELSSSSSFVTSMGCDNDGADAFRSELRRLYTRIVGRWKTYVVSRVVNENWRPSPSPGIAMYTDQTSPRPSASLVQALLSLSTSIQQLGLLTDHSHQHELACEMFNAFVEKLLNQLDNDTISAVHLHDTQPFWDLVLLRKMAELWGNEQVEMISRLDEKIAHLCHKFELDGIATSQFVSENLSRTQVLFAPLLPAPHLLSISHAAKGKSERTSSLMQYGSPTIEQKFHPALELVKPSPRFGLLLVGSDTIC